MGESYTFTAIGHVENPFNDPTSAETLRAAESRIVLEPEFALGLKGLEAGRRVLVVFVFHRSQGFELMQHPRGDRSRAKRGVFSLRSPRRPNAIGVSEVDLVAIEGNTLRVRRLDALNGTPILDLKPVL